MVSQLVRAIVGKGFFYYVTIGSTISVLALSANTAFADFPRLCQIVANDDFLPHAFAERGRRLVFSYGILTLTLLAGVILIIFEGVTDRLIPLYAIGAFLAFTLSQAGMVVHWKRLGASLHWGKLSVNALGASATGMTSLVVLVSKFSEGGWISAILIPLLCFFFYGVHRHYQTVAREIETTQPISLDHLREPIVIVPFRSWSKITRKAIGHAMQLSTEIYAVHVNNEDYSSLDLEQQWKKYVLDPIQKAKLREPILVRLPSPYRRLFGSLIDFIDEIERKSPERRIAIVIPNLSESKWYHYLLHNQRAVLLNAVLFLRRDHKVILVTVPWYLDN